ncbi:MAG: TAT-variant-translocated molybdopterin oxidoreductase [Chitinophagales bacterium]|nr:TAT-variant-translocated molybdopterin oxidoreductase [Chitinophagales bacterium]
MSKKKYWQSFGELNHTEAFQESTKNEFKEELLPLADLDDKGILDAKTPRRDFLKYLGFSTAAAAVAASCEMPVRRAVPYLKKSDDLVPGVANYYASTYVNGGDTISVVVKQRDGRPIKIEGNELSSITRGGTSARAQASVLDLYDNTRLRYPMQKDGKGFKEVTSFDAFDKLVAGSLLSTGGKPVVILTSTVNSPSTLAIINEFIAKYPGSRHVQYDAVSYSGMLLANEACYGKKAIPSYHFENAKVIVSLGADFLGTWLSPVEFSSQYAQNRKVTGEKPTLSRHIHFESTISLTGSNADDRYTHKPSETGAVALAILNQLNGTGASFSDKRLNEGIKLAADQLKAAGGNALVVCGSNDSNIQVVVNAINEAIGANGKTINWAVTSNYKNGIDADMTKLVDDMNGGNIGALFIWGVNPAYTLANSKKFKDGLGKVISVSFNGTMDETTELCRYVIPSHHWLESWGDAEPKSGYYSLMQPTINPLFKTRAFQTSLIKWSAAAGSQITDYDTYLKTYWTSKLGSVDLYNKALQDGVVEPAVMPVGTATFSNAKVAEATAAIGSIKSGKTEVVLYQKVSMGDGSQANNPWLQELPDPISKVTWDNYVLMSPAMAKELLGLDVMNQEGGKQSDYEVHPEKPVVRVTVSGVPPVELPVIVLPGINKDTIAIALGYGRESANKEETAVNIGRSANGAGKNAFPLVGFNGTNHYAVSCTVEKTGNLYPLAQTQVHGFTESRPVIYETNLGSYSSNPEAVLEEVTKEKEMLMAEGAKDFVRDATIYPEHEKPGIKWGMSIDLNTCTGCSACVVACTAENNVSVVGKIQVQRAHEMHWLRIDRYFTFNDANHDNVDVVFQPMLCQHCDNAPCENVCPVAATNHSSEGLNQMTYNRCIGTRYCANNCPFKVRRFNWLDYTGADSFPDNQNPMIEGKYMNESVLQMNDDLTRMVLNPDVTVRSRGVIEKCSFCVQRLQESKLNAKKAQDPSLVRNVKTACMQACPTHAISFGNVNDKESDVFKIRNVDQKHRTFYVLEQLHVLPNVSYLAKVRNTDRHIGVEEAHEEKKEGAKAHA